MVILLRMLMVSFLITTTHFCASCVHTDLSINRVRVQNWFGLWASPTWSSHDSISLYVCTYILIIMHVFNGYRKYYCLILVLTFGDAKEINVQIMRKFNLMSLLKSKFMIYVTITNYIIYIINKLLFCLFSSFSFVKQKGQLVNLLFKCSMDSNFIFKLIILKIYYAEEWYFLKLPSNNRVYFVPLVKPELFWRL